MDWRTGFTEMVQVLPDRGVRVVFGRGAVDHVADEARALGLPVLLVAGAHEESAANRVASVLGRSVAGRIGEVAQHVPTAFARAATDTAREVGAACVVAIGGGSATGLAKAVAHETGLPVLAVPTTYSGSEMTSIWGLTGAEGKRTGRDQRVLPRTVVYDPDLTLSLPPALSAASGLNAAAHALESLYAPDTTPDLRDLAERALEALVTALPRVVADPGDPDGRAEALYGASLAGRSLGSTTMGLQHKLAHLLGGRFGLPHAETHAVLLPQVAAVTAPGAGAGAAFRIAARAVGVEGPDAVATALFDLGVRLGTPTSLHDLGLARSDLARVEDEAGGSAVTHPVPVTAELLRRVLDAAWAGHRPR